MAGPPNAENIEKSGRRGSIEYAVRADGSKPAKDWLGDQPANVRAAFGVLFERLVSHGIRNELQFRKLQNVDGVWEFKKHEHRLFCFEHGRRWLLTNHYSKKGGSSRDQDKAARESRVIAEEHLERERELMRQEHVSDQQGDGHESERTDHEEPRRPEDLAPGEGDSGDD